MEGLTDAERARVAEMDALIAAHDRGRREAAAEKRRIRERARHRGKA